jgi:hypothetical protein
MKIGNIVGLSVLVAVTLSITAFAEEAKPGDKGQRGDKFKKADANSDGKLSLVEFKTIAGKDAEVKFAAADGDKDGFLTPEELKAARKSHKPNKGGEAKAVVPAPAVPAQ